MASDSKKAASVAITLICSYPAVVLPWGGVWIRDWDPWTQSMPIAQELSVGTKAVTVSDNASIL